MSCLRSLFRQGAGEPLFTRSLKDLNSKLRTSDDLRAFDRLALLEPFLEVVRSEQTTGLVTEAALVAVIALLKSKSIITLDAPECDEVLELIAEAATHCRFEASGEATVAMLICV